MRFPLAQRLLSIYALAIFALAWPALAGAGEVAVVLSEDSAVYRAVAETIQSRLQGTATVDIVHIPALRNPKQKDLRFLVAIGSQAASAAAASHIEAPLLVTLLPKSAFDRLAADRRRAADAQPLSALYLDQPIGRQFDLIRLAMPNARRVGVLLGPESDNLYPALQTAAQERQFRLTAQRVGSNSEIAPALQKLLPEIDVLLALPDPAVFNAGTIQLILLATYRQQLPLFGFSAAYVRAGAIASLHSTPVQIGNQAADMLRTALARGQLPPPRYSGQYTLATNPHVAHSLGIPLEGESALLLRMQQLDVR
jgi:putative tryptophan/tyrosine transport system substrate-binding protein